jgi:hypothetical protein
VCGDGACTHAETDASCTQDCPAVCGDSFCSSAKGENASTCGTDCGPVCGDTFCTHGENASTCASDCPAFCPDGFCTHTENASSCYQDCGWCGDGTCDGPETSVSCPGDCAPAQRFCTATYTLSPRMIIEGTTFGIGDGTFTLPTGTVILHYEANLGDNGPKAGGPVDVRYWWIRNEFSTSGGGVSTNTKVNAYTPRCNGEDVTAAWNPPPVTCLDDGNTTPMATGTWNGSTAVAWATCNAHPDWNSSSTTAYTPDDVSSGPGCLNNYHSRGNVSCSSGFLGSCGDGNLKSGNNEQNEIYVQPIPSLQLNATGTTISLPKTNIPNRSPSRTYIDFTGSRSAVTCN